MAACACTGAPSYEGPCSWCDVHGQPSVAFDHGVAEGRRQELEVVQLALAELGRLRKIEHAAQALVLDWVHTGSTIGLGKLRAAVEGVR